MKFTSWISIHKYFKLGPIDYYRSMNKFWNHFTNRMFSKGSKKRICQKVFIDIYFKNVYTLFVLNIKKTICALLYF